MKAVVIGSLGHLGNAIVRKWTASGIDVIPLDLPDFDLISRLLVLETITPLKPDVIVNAAGLEQIDWLETHPNTSRSVHVQGTANLREAAKRTDAILLQFSTAEVFGAATPQEKEHGFREQEQPEPLSVYAKTKLDSERAASEWKKHLIVRTSLLFGQTTPRSSGSLVDTIFNAVRRTRNFRVITDRYVTPTWTDHLAAAALDLVQYTEKKKEYGVYHLANRGTVSYYEIAEEIAAQTGLKLELEPISQADYGDKAPRCSFATLCCEQYENLPNVFPMPDWKAALAQYIESRAVAVEPQLNKNE